MRAVTAAAPSQEEVIAFLSGLHGAPVTDLEPLAPGVWSSAHAYRLAGRELVLRLGTVPEGFEMDRAAMAFDRTDLPVPEVLDVGEGLGCAYAISARHHGRFLETVTPDDADVAGATLVRILAALRTVGVVAGAPSAWYPSGISPEDSTWRGWLLDGLVDDPQGRVSGWRATLAAQPELDALFVATELRISQLLDGCPERRDLVHGDLLNRNVLIAEDASRTTAVYSWKCSVRGDFLFDVAWCTFWSPWHPGIEAVDLWPRVFDDRSLADGDLTDAAVRHHCYELQIGASHLGWNAWCGNDEDLRAVAAHTAAVLERGPLDLPRRRAMSAGSRRRPR